MFRRTPLLYRNPIRSRLLLYGDYYFRSFAVIIPFLAIFVQSMLLSNDVYKIVTCYIAT